MLRWIEKANHQVTYSDHKRSIRNRRGKRSVPPIWQPYDFIQAVELFDVTNLCGTPRVNHEVVRSRATGQWFT